MEKPKFPGEWNEWTGNILYPNEDSALWDVDGKCILFSTHRRHYSNNIFKDTKAAI